ncbi:Hypothetical predicted protein, partial [Paramuricea clavata]
MSEKLADCKMTIAEEIKRNANERVLALRDAEEKLLGRLEIVYTGKQKVLGLQRDGLELELGKISGCCEFAENVLKYENEVEILKNLSAIEYLGIIHASSTFASLSFAVDDGISTARVKVEVSFLVITKDRHGNRKEGGDRLNVLVRQPDGTISKSKVKDE